MSQSGFIPHDHSGCIAETLGAAEALCAREGLKFTPLRRRVLEILLTGHKALGAYEILDRLGEDGFSAKPPTAYRALEFLTTHGLAHKIESLNAYIACTHPGEAHDPAFLICTDCETVAETEAPAAVGPAAKAAGFKVKATTVEATGTCPACQAARP